MIKIKHGEKTGKKEVSLKVFPIETNVQGKKEKEENVVEKKEFSTVDCIQTPKRDEEVIQVSQEEVSKPKLPDEFIIINGQKFLNLDPPHIVFGNRYSEIISKSGDEYAIFLKNRFCPKCSAPSQPCQISKVLFPCGHFSCLKCAYTNKNQFSCRICKGCEFGDMDINMGENPDYTKILEQMVGSPESAYITTDSPSKLLLFTRFGLKNFTLTELMKKKVTLTELSNIGINLQQIRDHMNIKSAQDLKNLGLCYENVTDKSFFISGKLLKTFGIDRRYIIEETKVKIHQETGKDIRTIDLKSHKFKKMLIENGFNIVDLIELGWNKKLLSEDGFLDTDIQNLLYHKDNTFKLEKALHLLGITNFNFTGKNSKNQKKSTTPEIRHDLKKFIPMKKM